MVLFLTLALLLDSACAAACIPAQLDTREEHCASKHEDRGCDLHGHLKPATKNPAPATEVPACLESPAAAVDLASFTNASAPDAVFHVPPLPKRSAVLRI